MNPVMCLLIRPETESLLLFLLRGAGEDLTSDSSMKVAGVFAAIGMGMCGSLANLCTEAILKHQTDHSRGSDQSIFVQNTILYTYTSLLCLLAWVLDVSATGDAKSLFHGWNHKTWMLLVFQVRPDRQSIHAHIYWFTGFEGYLVQR